MFSNQSNHFVYKCYTFDRYFTLTINLPYFGKKNVFLSLILVNLKQKNLVFPVYFQNEIRLMHLLAFHTTHGFCLFQPK